MLHLALQLSREAQRVCRELFCYMVGAIRDMAQFVHCEPQDLVFVPNVTTALNTVLQNTPLRPGNKVLMLDIGYGSTKLIARAACEQHGAYLVLAEVQLPLEEGYDIQSRFLTCMAPWPYAGPLQHKQAKRSGL